MTEAFFNCAEIIVGFLSTSYSTTESDGQLYIQVGVISGSVQREVIVNLSISDLNGELNPTAHKFMWLCYTLDEFDDINLQVTFDSTTTTVDLPITIINNFFFELKESATANISFPGAPVRGVTLSPESALISNDGQLISNYCMINPKHIVYSTNPYFINPQRMRGGYGSHRVCLSVCPRASCYMPRL